MKWSERYSMLLSFDNAVLDYPSIRFNTSDGNAFWIGRGTVGGDAKIELLTRTAGNLPRGLLDQLRLLLAGVIRSENLSDSKVIQVPTRDLSEASLSRLEAAMDFALGAVVGRIQPGWRSMLL
jgi:hypothetical protein